MKKIRVMLADDHALMRDGLRLLLSTQGDMEVVAEAKDGDEVGQLVSSAKPDVVLLDTSMPPMPGDGVARQLATNHPEVKVVIVSCSMDETNMNHMRSIGVSGYIPRHVSFVNLSNAIRMVARGEKVFEPTQIADQLSPLERKGETELGPKGIEALKLMAQGHTNKEIAQIMDFNVKSVEGYKTKIGVKLGLDTRAEIFAYARKRGWLCE